MTQEFAREFEKIVADRTHLLKSEVSRNLKNLMTDIYPDKVHFIYELLQNADDAGAAQVRFDVSDGALVFSHNGIKQFDAQDVSAITNISASTKKDDYIKAGKFGIGFKSVYAFTDTPEIYCDSVDFRIERMFLPVEIAPQTSRAAGWTVFHLPFAGEEQRCSSSRSAILQGLDALEMDTLLFLNNITSLRYSIDGEDTVSFVKTIEKSLVTITCRKGGRLEEKRQWHHFVCNTKLHDTLARVGLAFFMTEDKNGRLLFNRKPGTVCMTFPAKNISSGLFFSINAPFGCPPSRDTININDEDNKFLLGELCALIGDAIEALKQEGLSDESLLSVLYTNKDNVRPFYAPLVESIRRAFQGRALLKAVDGEYVAARDAMVASGDVMDDILVIDDVRTLWQRDTMHFVQYPYDGNAREFLRALDIEMLSAKASKPVIAQMMLLDGTRRCDFLSWLGKIPDDRLGALYEWMSKEARQMRDDCNELTRQAEQARRWGQRSGASKELDDARNSITRLESTLLAKCDDGTFCEPKSAVIMTSSVPVPEGKKAMLDKVIRKERAVDFLVACGARKYGKEEYNRDLKRKSKADFTKWLGDVMVVNKLKGEETAIDVAIRVLDYAAKEEADAESGEVDRVDYGAYNFVWASRPNYGYAWKCPKDCCIDEPFEATGFATVTNVHGKFVLDKVYDKMEEKRKPAWIKFLKEHGIMCNVKVVAKNHDPGFSTRYDNDYIIDLLPVYLQKRSRALNLTMWRSLTCAGGWKDVYKFRWQKKTSRGSATLLVSTVLLLLRGSAWIPNGDGVMKKPCDISPDTIDKDFVLDWRNGFLEAIGLGANEKARMQAEKAKQESFKDAATTLGFGSAEEAVNAKSAAEFVAWMKAKGMNPDDFKRQYEAEHTERVLHTDTIKEAIHKKARSSDDADDDDDDYDEDDDDDVANAIPNANRRREKVAEQMEEAGTEATTGVYCRTVNDEAVKQFLKEQYSGKCQICGTRIKMRNGEPHFHAIAWLKQADLKREYNTGICTAWNALCLCPNCAARWKYSKVEMLDFIERVKEKAVQNRDGAMCKFGVRIEDEQRNVRYTPKHLIALQEALKYFASAAACSPTPVSPAAYPLALRRLDAFAPCRL